MMLGNSGGNIFLDKSKAPYANPGLNHLVVLCLQFVSIFSETQDLLTTIDFNTLYCILYR